MVFPNPPQHLLHSQWENAVNATPFDATPLDCLRDAFQALLSEPCPPSLSGAELGLGLPARDIELPELKSILMSRTTRPEVKRAIWVQVIDHVRARESTWTVVAAGLAYPGLAGSVLRVCRNVPGDPSDIQAEIITEFLAALARIDVNDPDIGDIAGWLCWRALNASKAFRTAEAASGARSGVLPRAVIPLFPAGHPDIVLARAVRAGVLTAMESDLIGRSYLQGEHYASLAADYGMAVSTFYRCRTNAVRRLVEAIESGILTPL